MMKKYLNNKRRLIKRMYGALSLTTALFIFQACYGSPQDYGLDNVIEGVVKSSESNEPIKGIKVSVPALNQYVFTDSEGSFSMYIQPESKYELLFEDVDAEMNGTYKSKDTIITDVTEEMFINVALEVE